MTPRPTSQNTTFLEILRHHSTSSLGLPRLVPGPHGVPINGYTFPPGTSLSVPSYTIHHSPAIWNPTSNPAFDPEIFNPDRWRPECVTEQQKAAFIPFSTGPRACVGRNVAEMELKIIFGVLGQCFEFEMRDQGAGTVGWETREGFLRKPVGFRVGMRRRERSAERSE